MFQTIRAMEREFGRPIGVLQDLQGPKIRLGVLKGGKRKLAAGDEVRFVLAKSQSEDGSIPLPHAEIFEATAPGHELLIDDGRVRVRINSPGYNDMSGTVMVGGTISDRKGVNLPQSRLNISPITQKDRTDLAFGLEMGVDWVALSFVQQPSDVLDARALIGDKAGIVAKIEKPLALNHLGDIIRLADGVMVARGDLGVEIPCEDVPGRQKELLRACRQAAKPVIFATQMLDSMVVAPIPTRAEASDVATAIYDGADAVMLSAESATGAYPVEAVRMMDRIIKSTESHRMYRSLIDATQTDEETTTPHAVAAASAALAVSIGAKAIVGLTASGTTAARIARKRPSLPILALTPDEKTARRMSMLWGVHSVVSGEPASYDAMAQIAASAALKVGYAAPGDSIVVVSGMPFGQAGATNNLRVVAC